MGARLAKIANTSRDRDPLVKTTSDLLYKHAKALHPKILADSAKVGYYLPAPVQLSQID